MLPKQWILHNNNKYFFDNINSFIINNKIRIIGFNTDLPNGILIANCCFQILSGYSLLIHK